MWYMGDYPGVGACPEHYGTPLYPHTLYAVLAWGDQNRFLTMDQVLLCIRYLPLY